MNYSKSLIPGAIARDALREGRKLSSIVTAGMDGVTCLPIAYGATGIALTFPDPLPTAIAAAGSALLYCGGRALLNWYRKL